MNWKCKINIHQFVDEFTHSVGDAKKDFKITKNKIVKELKKCDDFKKGVGADLVGMLEESSDVDTFDENLDIVYEFADENKIWLGAPGEFIRGRN